MALALKELTYVPEAGGDILLNIGSIDFDGSKYTTKEEAAKAFYAALLPVARVYNGHDGEVLLWTPDTNNFCKGQWGVCWESGPYCWAIEMSMLLQGPGWFTEPYYSFDLHWTD